MTVSYAPGPKSPGLMGFLKEFQADFLGLFCRAMNEHGDMVHLRVGPLHAHAVRSPEIISELLLDRAGEFIKAEQSNGLVARFLGQSMLTMHGDEARRRRNLVMPSFQRARIAGYANQMAKIAQEVSSSWPAEIDLTQAMMELSMSVITQTVVGLRDASMQRSIDQTMREIEKAFLELLTSLIPAPSWFPFGAAARMRQNTARLDEIFLKLIADHRKAGDNGDLLSMLILAKDGDLALTDKQVLAEVKTAYIAGFDTTAKAFVWLFYLLAQHPHVEQKLRAELETVLQGRLPTFDDLPKLKYLDQVIKETLRSMTSVPVFTRSPLKDTTLGGFRVNRGDPIFVVVEAAHKNPKFFPEPDLFNPERWTPEFEKALPKTAFMPFSAGSRICVGWHFAMAELAMGTATLLQSNRWTLIPGQTVEAVSQITRGPKAALKFQLEPIRPAAAA
jgi:cytochrome P450